MIDKNYLIVKTEEHRSEFLEHLNSYDIIAFDVEATGLNTRKDVVIGLSISGKAGYGYYLPLYSWNGKGLVEHKNNFDIMEEVSYTLQEKKLLTWNGTYDVRIFESNFGVDLAPSIYADGMLLKHTVQEEGPFGLKPTGIELQEEIGLNVEEEANKEQIELKENVAKNGGSTTKSNYEMYKADLPVLGKYACADADLTLRICNYYLNKIEEQDLEQFFFEDEVMPLYRDVTIPMESNGVVLDMELLQKSREEIEQDLEKLELDVIEALKKSEAFNRWLSDKSMEKFPASPRGSFAQEYVSLAELDLPKTKAGKYSLTEKVIKTIDGKHQDFLMGNKEAISEELHKTISLNLWTKKEGGYVNISSKKQMGEIVFDYMGISPISRTDKGAPQFNNDMIQKLAQDGQSWAKSLHNYNKLVKIKSSYIDRFLDNEEEGKYYFSYKQHGTISGRYGSDAQQLPRPMEEGQEDEIVIKYVNRVRKFFVSGSDRVFIDCDYESLEPHTFAHISGDPGLIDIFNNGHDFYSTIAIATEKLEGVSADKKADNYLGKVDKQKRQVAKAYALGVPYGMGGYALGKSLDIPTEEAEQLIDSYLNAYPKLKDWMKKSKRSAQYDGFVRSEAGRIRHLEKVKDLHKIYREDLLDFRKRNKYLKKLGKEELNNLYKDYKNGINNSRNFQVQSMAASIVNRAAIAINRKLKEMGIDGYCCAQIHDQLIVNVPKDKAEECKYIVQELMENTTKLSLELKAPPELGENWYEAH